MKLNSGTMFKEEIEGKRRRSRGQEMEGIESVDEGRKGKEGKGDKWWRRWSAENKVLNDWDYGEGEKEK